MSKSAQKIAEDAVASALAPATPEWLPPLPLTTEEPRQPYPLAALPKIIRLAVEEVVAFSQFPVAMAACSALSVLSLVGQGIANIRRAEKLEGPTSLYFLVVAESGERKTTADTAFMSAIYAFDKRMRKENEDIIAHYHASVAIYEGKKQGLRSRIAQAKKGLKEDLEAEAQLRELETRIPKPPFVPRLGYADATPEALALALANNWPIGGVISSEAGVVFGSHAMNKDSVMRNLALHNTLWDGKTFVVDRVTAPSFILDGARLSMCLAVQPGTVRAFFENTKGLARDTGFAARFLICEPLSTQGTRFYKEPAVGLPFLAGFHRRTNELLEKTPNFTNGILDLPTLSFSHEAKRAWVKFHDDVEGEIGPDGSMFDARDVASKAADNVARLAALFHIFEGGTTDSEIGEANVVAAGAIVGWHLYEAQRFLNGMNIRPDTNLAIKLEAWLITFCKERAVSEVSATDIMQRGPNSIRKKKVLTHVLAELAEHHRVQVKEVGQSRTVMINPALLVGEPDGTP